MLCAGEVVFELEEATTMLTEAGYVVGTDQFKREFARRYLPTETHGAVSESPAIFLSADERQEIEGLCNQDRWTALFNHYDLVRPSRLVDHRTAVNELGRELEHIKCSDTDIKFHQLYLKLRRERSLSHENALYAAEQGWFAGGV